MELKEWICKCCTAPVDPREAVGRVLRCKHCGSVFTLAKETEPEVTALLRMGEHDLDACKFDEAYTAYRRAAELDGEEPEAYFGMALASFKVQYLKDEAAELPRLQPICHEISEKSFSADGNYLRALELASKEKGAAIDEIRDQFNELKESGLDYDCFLCVKVSDDRGGTTQDSHEALKLYHHLKEKGYAPFYSEAETGTRTGSDYEALILYALYTSECMLLVCSDEEYLQTKWVKNEYVRFTAMIANEEKERDALTFIFRGKPVERLPGKSGKVQGIDLLRPDAYTRVDEFVEKHTPTARARREAEKKRRRAAEEARSLEVEEMKRRLEESERRRKETEEAEEKRRRAEEEKRKKEEEARAEEAEKKRLAEEERTRQYENLMRLLEENERRNHVKQPTKLVCVYCSNDISVEPGTDLSAVRCPCCGGHKFLTEEEARAQEEERKRRAEEDARNKELAELREKLAQMERERAASAAPANLSPAQLLAMMRQAEEDEKRRREEEAARAEAERIQREEEEKKRKAEEERKRRAEKARLAAESRAREEEARREKEEAERIAAARRAREEEEKRLREEERKRQEAEEARLAAERLEREKAERKKQEEEARHADAAQFEIEGDELVKYIGRGGEVTIPNYIKKIGPSAFCDCEKLTRVVIPDSVREIGYNAFCMCENLKEAEIGNGVKTIGKQAFHLCSSLKRIVIPDSVETIGESAFGYCSQCTSFSFGKNIREVGLRAFESARALKKVEIKDLAQWCRVLGPAVASGCYNEKDLYLNGKKVTELSIPQGVTEIAPRAFEHISGLTKIVLPAGLTTIGEDAFFCSCGNLMSLTIPESVTSIGKGAFEARGIGKLRQVTIPKRLAGLFNVNLKRIFGTVLYGRISFTFTK